MPASCNNNATAFHVAMSMSTTQNDASPTSKFFKCFLSYLKHDQKRKLIYCHHLNTRQIDRQIDCVSGEKCSIPSSKIFTLKTAKNVEMLKKERNVSKGGARIKITGVAPNSGERQHLAFSSFLLARRTRRCCCCYKDKCFCFWKETNFMKLSCSAIDINSMDGGKLERFSASKYYFRQSQFVQTIPRYFLVLL